jgi:hypothetical protein
MFDATAMPDPGSAPTAAPRPLPLGGAAALPYSTQPVKSRVRVERDAFGGITITILPMTLRTLALLDLFISSIMTLLLVALILHTDYATTPAALLRAPALALRWALTWAGLTALHAAAAFLMSLALVRRTTFVRVFGDTLSVHRRRWFRRSRREWPVLAVRGTRVTRLDNLALLDADGTVLCKLSVPDTVDLPWLSLVIHDAIGQVTAVPEPAASNGTWGGLD